MKPFTKLIAMNSMSYSDMQSFLSPKELSSIIEQRHRLKKTKKHISTDYKDDGQALL